MWQEKQTGCLLEEVLVCAFMIYRWILLGMRSVLCLEMMWKNMVEPDTLQVTVCGSCALHAGWRRPPTHPPTHTHTHTHTHTEYVIPADFPCAVVTRRRLILYVHCLSSIITRVFSIWPSWTKCKGTYFLGMQYLSDRFLFAIMVLFWV